MVPICRFCNPPHSDHSHFIGIPVILKGHQSQSSAFAVAVSLTTFPAVTPIVTNLVPGISLDMTGDMSDINVIKSLLKGGSLALVFVSYLILIINIIICFQWIFTII